jgi:hypothetical protein
MATSALRKEERMFKRLLFVTAVLAMTVAPAMGVTASKDGTPIEPNPGPGNVPTGTRADFEYNTGGPINVVPTLGGSATGWGTFFITVLYNDTGHDLCLQEFGFPCGGPPVSWGWVVWTNLPNMNPPPGDGYSSNYNGGFTPADPNPGTFPPTTYTYIDVASESIVIGAGTYWAFGYENPGMGGQVDFNGVTTYAWYLGMWDPDPGWGRTAVLQVFANYGTTPADDTTWGEIKALFR